MATFLYTLIIYPLYTIIECVYTLFNRFTDNTGFCIIGVSIGVSLLCLPLYAVAEHWQEIEHKKQLSMKPVIDHIKKVFKGDERYMMTVAFYKENHYNQLMGLRSSFGLLIQIPFFIAAYTFLSHLPALNGRSFLFISDMGKQDALFHIASFPINVLPIAMTLINIVSGIIYTRGFSFREKLTPIIIALVFLVILYPSPSGLVFYWTCNNIFSLLKNIFYKFKNPLKAFWIFSVLVLIPVSIMVLFFSSTKWKYKIIYLFLVSIIFFLPLIIKKSSLLLKNTIFTLINDKKNRISLYLISCLALFMLTGLVIPSTLISSSTGDFANLNSHKNPLLYIAMTAIQSAGFFIFWASCIFFLFNSKIQSFLTFFFSATAICSTLNTFIFKIFYGDISTSLVFLNQSSDFKTISIISLVNLLTIAIIFLLTFIFIQKKWHKILTSVMIIFTIAFFALSLTNIHKIQSAYSEFVSAGNKNTVQKIEPIFHLSKTKENVVLFMLDRAEGEFINEIFKEAPELKDIYRGFIHYNNCISFNSHTFQGSPGIYGGYEYTPLEINKRSSELLKDKHNQAILLLPRIFSEEKGFSACVTDPSWANHSDYMDLSIFNPYPNINGYQTIGPYTSLWYSKHDKQFSESFDKSEFLIKRNLLFFSIFRASPIIARELIYKKGTWWSPDEAGKNFNEFMDSYAPLDFLPKLTDFSCKKNGSYICIVNETTHKAAYLQAPDFVPQKNITNLGTSKYKESEDYHTEMAAIKRIGTWLQYLKENGVYDNTKIIIVSDHGNMGGDENMEKNDKLDEEIYGGKQHGRGRFHCLLMVKDFGASGEMREDQTTFMTNADVPSIALKGIVENPVNPFTNKPIPLDTTSFKKDGVIISANDNHVPTTNGKYTFKIDNDQWWLVKDNIFKSENWKKVNPFSE